MKLVSICQGEDALATRQDYHPPLFDFDFILRLILNAFKALSSLTALAPYGAYP